MAQLHVSLTADLQRYVDSRVLNEGYADPADFVRDLIVRHQGDHEASLRRLQALIDEGIASGMLDADADDILDEIIAEDPDLRA